MAKVAKSIRVDQKVYDYIEKYKGEGFNEKFENIIMDSMESEKKRLERIKLLDSQIKDKEKQLQKISEDAYRLTAVQYRVNNIIKAFKDIEDKLGIEPVNVSQKEPARKISGR